MPSNMPVWLPGVSVCVVFLVVGVLISLHPRFRKIYRATDVVGVLHFNSAAAWMGVIPGLVVGVPMLIGLPLPISVPAAAPPLLVAALAYLRPKRAVQGCEVDQIGAITLTRGNVRIPFDLNHYRYIRMHQNSSGTLNYPSMMVLYRDTVPSVSTWLGSVLFPRVDDERVILFFNRWHTADGYFVGPGTLGALFYQACVRAGRTPIERGDGGWGVRPQ